MPPEVAEAIETVLAKEQYRTSTWGVIAHDEESGDVLVDVNGEKLYVTGSILKTLSAAGVLEAYGPDHTFPTPVYGTAAVDGRCARGNLVLVASGGDFSFGLRDQPDGTLEYASLPVLDHNETNTGLPGGTAPSGNPSAALDDLSVQIAAAGVTSIEGEVIIDDRIFEAYPAWPDGIVAPIWFNENVVDITITPGAAGGDPATVSWAPQTAAYTVQSTVTTISEGEEAEELTPILVSPGVIQVTGTSRSGRTRRCASTRSRIRRRGPGRRSSSRCSGRGSPSRPRRPAPTRPSLLPAGPYDDASKLAEHTSAPLSELVKVVLKVSYNRGADLLVCLTAVRTARRHARRASHRPSRPSLRSASSMAPRSCSTAPAPTSVTAPRPNR